MRKALVIGCAGQDGSYLCDLLLEKGYEVFGVSPFGASLHTLSHLLASGYTHSRFHLLRGDLLDTTSLYRILQEVKPDEIYNEGDIDSIPWSFDIPSLSWDVTAGSVVRLLEIIRQICPQARVFQPLSITIFGASSAPQNESSPLDPRSPYAVAKSAILLLSRYHRLTNNLFLSTIAFGNHTSPRQSTEYLLPKICKGAVDIALGRQKYLTVGNLDQKVDIGLASEYIEAAWLSLQRDTPDDYVLGTGSSFLSIGRIIETAFQIAGVKRNWCEAVKMDPRFSALKPLYSPDIRKAREKLNWNPRHSTAGTIKHLIEHYLSQESG